MSITTKTKSFSTKIQTQMTRIFCVKRYSYPIPNVHLVLKYSKMPTERSVSVVLKDVVFNNTQYEQSSLPSSPPSSPSSPSSPPSSPPSPPSSPNSCFSANSFSSTDSCDTLGSSNAEKIEEILLIIETLQLRVVNGLKRLEEQQNRMSLIETVLHEHLESKQN